MTRQMDQGPPGFTIWITGMSGAGKSTLAELLERELRGRGRRVEVLDGDAVRAALTPDLGFTRADRDENVRRVGWLCELLARNGVVAVAALISPYREARDGVRSRVGRFIEVHMDAPISTLAARDVKGLYRRATAGDLQGFTGHDDPYEPPIEPEVRCTSDGSETPEECAARVLRAAEQLGYLVLSAPE
jgi:adenylylsulfate kinase